MKKNPEIHIIVQARMSSTRLPGKVMFPILGKPVIQHIWELLQRSATARKVIIATSDSPNDDSLAAFLTNLGASVYRGDENDVLSRFYQAAKQFGSDLIVRITADDPLKDPTLIDYAVRSVLQKPEIDYLSNTIRPSFPAGQEVEVFWFKTLERAFNDAKLASEREHVTPYIWKNTGLFNVQNFEHTENLGHWRWTLDKPEDLELISLLYQRFYQDGKLAGFLEIIEYLKTRPDLVAMNIDTDRNEGYFKSIANER